MFRWLLTIFIALTTPDALHPYYHRRSKRHPEFRRRVLAALAGKHRSELVPTTIELRPNLSVELRGICHARNTASPLMRIKTGEIAKLQSY